MSASELSNKSRGEGTESTPHGKRVEQVKDGGDGPRWQADSDEVSFITESRGEQDCAVEEEQHLLRGAELLLISGIVPV